MYLLVKKINIFIILILIISGISYLRSEVYYPTNTKLPIGDTTLYRQLQDSVYKIYSKLGVTARSLFQYNLSLSDELWQKLTNKSEDLPYQLAMRSLSVVPSTAFKPSGVEIVQRQEAIAAGLRLPTGLSYPQGGLRVPLDLIGQFLGIVEDVSPEIRYTIDAPNEIEIVIYSMQAKVIATLFKGRQVPGSYEISWNFRDENGRRMTSGDYIAEVRIGNTKYIRKRIVIP